MAELQTIPARHGVATFVPAGQVIKIVNTSGTQVVDAWAFALPKPEGKKGDDNDQIAPKEGDETNEERGKEEGDGSDEGVKNAPKKSKKMSEETTDLPGQEDAEQATQGLVQSKKADAGKGAGGGTAESGGGGWSSYIPKVYSSQKEDGETEQRKNSKTWASYFPSGKGFGSYIPKTANDTISSFARDHQRDVSKTYLEQLQDFSKTPVGAAGTSGMAVATGSGYGGSLYAGYQAWNSTHAADGPRMQWMSMPRTRAAILRLRPRVGDVMVSNHGSPRYIDPRVWPVAVPCAGVAEWEKHRSCSENLVLALKELNERAGLKGAKGVGAEVTVNSVPAPLNLWMNIPWDAEGNVSFDGPASKAGDFVRLKAERDVVVVMSACPNDVQGINGEGIDDAHFLVEDDDPTAALHRSRVVEKHPPPRKVGSQQAQPGAAAASADRKSPALARKKPIPPAVKKPTPPTAEKAASTPATAPKRQSVSSTVVSTSSSTNPATKSHATKGTTSVVEAEHQTKTPRKPPRKLVPGRKSAGTGTGANA